MKKLLCLILAPVLVLASNSPFSRVRVMKYDADGSPSEEVNDMVICLERNPTSTEKKNYEDVLGYYADGLYEATNGANFVGNVIVYTSGRYCSSADITWDKGGRWPGAGGGNFPLIGGGIGVSDVWHNPNSGVDTPMMDSDKNRFDFGITLVHETMHYRYGIDDDYSKSTLIRPSLVLFTDGSTDYNCEVTANPVTDEITIKNKFINVTRFKRMMKAYSEGTPVIFNAVDGGRFPKGLKDGPISNREKKDGSGDLAKDYGYLTEDYAIIDIVDASRLDEGNGVYSFALKDARGNRIDIEDAGQGVWGVDRPDNISVAHSLMNYQYDVATSRACDANNIQWQWANLSTEHNVNEFSPMGICCRDINGNILSGWDAVTINPDYEFVDGVKQDKSFRYWYKSLIKKKPTETDVFRAKSFLKNYNPDNGLVNEGYAVWVRDETCGNELTYDLPFMKVELAGRSPTEYQKDTRKYLNIQWVDAPKTEVIVLVDHSASMTSKVLDESGNAITDNSGNKLQKIDIARQVAKFVAQGFLSQLPKLGMGKSGETEYDVSNVSVGVYSFNEKVSTVYGSRYNPTLADIVTNIDAVSANGSTALFDALYAMEGKFSTDPSSQKILYVISDGLNMRGSHTKEDVVKLYNSRNIAVHAFAYGHDANIELLASMASETNGTFYENEGNLSIDVINAVGASLSTYAAYQQMMSASVSANSMSRQVYMPQRTKFAKVYGSYDGTPSNNPVEIVASDGSVLRSYTYNVNVANKNYFVVEVDSTTLANLADPYIKVRNNLNKASVDVRTFVTNEFDEHSMNVSLMPTGPFEWPSQRFFVASVRGGNGLLAELTATGKLIKPDGSVQVFNLHDDGLNGDNLAGDGVYFADLPSISQNGTYQWEISMSNKNGKAHTTHVGTSLPDTIPFVEKTDATPFELFHNGQFVISGCCNDEPTSNFLELYPEKRVNAYLQSGVDEDRFKIVGTQSGKSYALYLSSRNLDSFDNIKVYSPTDLMTPVYTLNVEPKNDYNSVSVPLSSEYAKPGYVIAVNGTKSVGTNYDIILLERNYAEFAVGRFEQGTDWHSEHTVVALDAKRKNEGLRSLVTPAGWKIIESRDISTTDFELVGERLDLDIFVPTNTQNPYWIGNVELWLSVPSSNKRIQLGSQQEIQAYLGGWKSYGFGVNDEVREILAESHSDVHFQIVLNTSDSVWIDNLRFAGKMVDNPVNKSAPVCPGGSGCSVVESIKLRINESIRVAVDGDVYVEVTGFPSDWTPEKVKIGVSSEDGSPMMGTLSYDGGSYPLNDWYLEKLFDFTSGKRYLLKLHNVGGRLYRVSAWTEGLARDFASAGGILNFIWNVKF